MFPLPLREGVGGGVRSADVGRESTHNPALQHPPPSPSPARGEGKNNFVHCDRTTPGQDRGGAFSSSCSPYVAKLSSVSSISASESNTGPPIRSA